MLRNLYSCSYTKSSKQILFFIRKYVRHRVFRTKFSYIPMTTLWKIRIWKSIWYKSPCDNAHETLCSKHGWIIRDYVFADLYNLLKENLTKIFDSTPCSFLHNAPWLQNNNQVYESLYNIHAENINTKFNIFMLSVLQSM